MVFFKIHPPGNLLFFQWFPAINSDQKTLWEKGAHQVDGAAAHGGGSTMPVARGVKCFRFFQRSDKTTQMDLERIILSWTSRHLRPGQRSRRGVLFGLLSVALSACGWKSGSKRSEAPDSEVLGGDSEATSGDSGGLVGDSLEDTGCSGPEPDAKAGWIEVPLKEHPALRKHGGQAAVDTQSVPSSKVIEPGVSTNSPFPWTSPGPRKCPSGVTFSKY